MKKQNGNVEIGIILITAILCSILFSACSVKVEFGYHGETGRDDRTQTELKRGQLARQSDKY